VVITRGIGWSCQCSLFSEEVDQVDYSLDSLKGQIIWKMLVGSQMDERVLRSANEGEIWGWLSQAAPTGAVNTPCFGSVLLGPGTGFPLLEIPISVMGCFHCCFVHPDSSKARWISHPLSHGLFSLSL
jgi:hypothetical protein